MLRRLSSWLLTLAASFAVLVAPAAAQRMSAELRALDAQLPGKLINDPTRIDWEIYGNQVSSKPLVDASIPGGGAALQVEIKRAAEFIYTAGLNIPLIGSIDDGDQVTVGFYARAKSARSDDGNGVIRVRFQQNDAPFPGFGEKTLSIGQEWKWYEVTAKAELALRKKDGIIAIQFGRTRQILEFGQTIVVKGSSAIAAAPQEAAAPKPKPQTTIPSSLQNVGTLLNDPSKANWFMESKAGTITPMDDIALYGTAATRLSVSQANSQPHDMFISIPITSALAEGDDLIIAVAGRSADPASPAQVALRIEQAAPPYAGFAENEIELTGKWRLIRVKTKAAKSFGPNEAQLALHFGGAEKIVDIGPVYIFKVE